MCNVAIGEAQTCKGNFSNTNCSENCVLSYLHHACSAGATVWGDVFSLNGFPVNPVSCINCFASICFNQLNCAGGQVFCVPD